MKTEGSAISDYFDRFSKSYTRFDKARTLVHQSSLKVFNELDNGLLQIEDLKLIYKAQSPNVRDLSPEEQRKIRAQKAELHLKMIEEQQKQRQQIMIETDRKYREVLQQKPLYLILNEQDEKQQLSVLEERKQRLEQIRNLRQPISPSLIKEHEKKYLEFKSQKRGRSVTSNDVTIQFEKSELYNRIIQEEQERELQKQIKQNEVKELYEKRKKFGQMIKEKYLPSVSPEKVLERENQIKKTYPQRKQHSENRDYHTTKVYRQKIREIDWTQIDTQNTTERDDRIIKQARKLENKSIQQEQLQRARGVYNQDADKYLIGSIKAKLSILEN
ncbi:hypothetical protein pb186bvf_019207 [Paramecium bursaria]